MRSKILYMVAFLAVASAYSCEVSVLPPTGAKYPFTKQTYDLSTLVDPSWYEVKDSSQDFVYFFNVCANVAKNITINGKQINCPRVNQGRLYPAYQANTNGANCMNIGSGADDLDVEVNLIDAEDPSVGITYQYRNGMSSGCNGVGRSLRLNFFCSTYYEIIQGDARVWEDPMCTYNMNLLSMAGCPRSCGQFDRVMCNGRGACAFDREQKTSRCLCKEGYFGTACERTGSDESVLTIRSLVLLIISSLLLFVIFGLTMLWRKVKNLRLDPEAYAAVNDEKMGLVDIQ